MFEWEREEGAEVHKLGVKSSERVLTELEDVGQQLALIFNGEGSAFAVGGEVGSTLGIVVLIFGEFSLCHCQQHLLNVGNYDLFMFHVFVVL